MKVQSRRRVGFGARIAAWFRCSLNKQTANGSKGQAGFGIVLLVGKFKLQMGDHNEVGNKGICSC